MQEFDLWQLVGLEQDKVSEQLQFWMAATFAVVIASYTAGPRPAIWARLAIATLYGASELVFRPAGFLRAIDYWRVAPFVSCFSVSVQP